MAEKDRNDDEADGVNVTNEAAKAVAVGTVAGVGTTAVATAGKKFNQIVVRRKASNC